MITANQVYRYTGLMCQYIIQNTIPVNWYPKLYFTKYFPSWAMQKSWKQGFRF